MKPLVFILLLFISLISKGQVYLDPDTDINDRVEDLLERMSLEEKIGQMTQGEKSTVEGSDLKDISTYYLGSVLSGGGNAPSPNTVDGWIDMYNSMQNEARSTPLGIPLLYGIDAVHGHNNLIGSVIFPHNIGLGCTRNPELVEEITRITALEVRATGPKWNFSPCVTVPQNIFWGRTYEGFSENTDLVKELGKAAVLGYQSGGLGSENSVLASAKHFIGDGGTEHGIDQGNTVLSEDELRRIHLPPYLSAIDAGVGTIMASFNSWNGEKCHGHKYLLNDLLKTELGFDGFIIADWKGINQVDGDFKEAIRKSINAGIDMGMQPDDYIEYIEHLTNLVNEGSVSMDRIDDAVRRILRIKFKMGLFEQDPVTNALKDTVGSQTHREVGRQAVRESLVLLKNDGILPLPKENSNILVAGFKGDDIGAMCGGWSIHWQGSYGDITEGTTILQGLKNSIGSQNITYTNNHNNIPEADYAVVVVGEAPYAESVGDIFHEGESGFKLSQQDKNMVNAVQAKGIPMVVILLSGRPLDIRNQLNSSNAFIAAWLPGTEGGSGIADVIFGDYDFKGKLSYTWPESFYDVPMSIMSDNTGNEALFEYGYGLTFDDVNYVNNSKHFKNVNVYPNPVRNQLTIELKENINANIMLTDAMGRVLFKKDTNISPTTSMDMTDFLPGMYFLKIENDNYIITKKLIKN